MAAERGPTPYSHEYRPSLDILSSVPHRELRAERLDPQRLYVATHELQHALVGKWCGLTVTEISTIPEGNIGGYTSFAPTENIAAFQKAAAASMVAGPHGDPHGFGHDQQQINYLSMLPGSHSLQTAFVEAAYILNHYPMEVRERAAEIIAYLQKVSGSDIELILERARQEIEEEKGERIEINLPPIKQAINNIEPQIEENELTHREIGIIWERLPDGSVMERIVEIEVCNICKGKNGHFEGCELAQEDEMTIEEEPIAA